jgi:hypothetical protein
MNENRLLSEQVKNCVDWEGRKEGRKERNEWNGKE